MNASLAQFWVNTTAKFEALNQRERWLVFGAVLVVVYAILNTLLLDPVLTHKKTLTNTIMADQAQIDTLNQQLSQYSQQAITDPDTQNKQHIAALQLNLQNLERQLSDLQTTLVSPEQIPELLRSLLQKNGNLKLIALNTLPTTGLLESTHAEKENSAQMASIQPTPTTQTLSEPYTAPVFKHGVEITLEGNYLDLLAYVSALEKTPWHVLWSKASLNAADAQPMPLWPTNRLKLTVYTLSLDHTWLSI